MRCLSLQLQVPTLQGARCLSILEPIGFPPSITLDLALMTFGARSWISGDLREVHFRLCQENFLSPSCERDILPPYPGCFAFSQNLVFLPPTSIVIPHTWKALVLRASLLPSPFKSHCPPQMMILLIPLGQLKEKVGSASVTPLLLTRIKNLRHMCDVNLTNLSTLLPYPVNSFLPLGIPRISCSHRDLH